ncbi:hypothetical protein DFP72DRAFT_849184 [Ephemerocybe angulata]|uniref:Uncharacterized protein n=1 Tax=Ephemerocybe angulata TaxID=980116 RepID=A0A8H6HUM0_9AGAR|nr:hypothetical protein DFP72DRAFT_849184 [Tulosesus angulatus]
MSPTLLESLGGRRYVVIQPSFFYYLSPPAIVTGPLNALCQSGNTPWTPAHILLKLQPWPIRTYTCRAIGFTSPKADRHQHPCRLTPEIPLRQRMAFRANVGGSHPGTSLASLSDVAADFIARRTRFCCVWAMPAQRIDSRMRAGMTRTLFLLGGRNSIASSTFRLQHHDSQQRLTHAPGAASRPQVPPFRHPVFTNFYSDVACPVSPTALAGTRYVVISRSTTKIENSGPRKSVNRFNGISPVPPLAGFISVVLSTCRRSAWAPHTVTARGIFPVSSRDLALTQSPPQETLITSEMLQTTQGDHECAHYHIVLSAPLTFLFRIQASRLAFRLTHKLNHYAELKGSRNAVKVNAITSAAEPRLHQIAAFGVLVRHSGSRCHPGCYRTQCI